MVALYCPDWNIQRRHGIRTQTSILRQDDKLVEALSEALGVGIYHGHVQHRPTILVCNMEGVSVGAGEQVEGWEGTRGGSEGADAEAVSWAGGELL